MAINGDALFGVHANALKTYSTRNRILASNIANADTPHYKARDVDFKTVLSDASRGASTLRKTHSRHIGAGAGLGSDRAELLYRVPHQPALDGNTVEADVEQAAFAENAMRYQAGLTFINRRIKGLVAAITGGR